MRTSRSIPSTSPVGSALRRAGSIGREALLLTAGIALLESAGSYAPHDGTDLIIVVGAVLGAMLLAQAARLGWMPASQRLVRGAWARLRTLGRTLSPRYAVAFRPSPEANALPDRTLAAPSLWLLGALIVCAAAGPYIFDGLLFLKTSVAYVPYLLGIALVWSVLSVGIIFGCVAAAQWLHQIARRRGASVLPFLLFGAGWIGGLIALSLLPGWVALVGVLVAGWWSGRHLGDMPAQGYLFCRRDGTGRARTIPVQEYLKQAHTVIVLALAVVVTLGQAHRLWFAAWPEAPFAFTHWLGLLASMCSLLLVVRAGAHFRRIIGGGDVPPEVPLTPTLWLKRSRIREEGGEEERLERYWYDIARDSGWLVLRDTDEPRHAYDLVLGEDDSARRFQPREAFDDADARFQLARRFHVTLRRRFRRSFQLLFKQLRRETPPDGTGYLFCPHVWLVPGVVRDIEARDRSSSQVVGPSFYGPPYNQAFTSRERRYIGAVLRDLQIDIVYFEDAVTWKDIRRVLTIAYEIHDQRRAPLRERHFMGVPRVRVVIQEEAAEAEAPAAIPAKDPAALPETSPGHARILLILRDRGTREDELVPDPADHGIRTPHLVG